MTVSGRSTSGYRPVPARPKPDPRQRGTAELLRQTHLVQCVAPYGASRFAVTTALSLLPLLCRRAAVAPYHLCQLSSLITDRASLMSNPFTLIS